MKSKLVRQEHLPSSTTTYSSIPFNIRIVVVKTAWYNVRAIQIVAVKTAWYNVGAISTIASTLHPDVIDMQNIGHSAYSVLSVVQSAVN